MNPDNRKKIRDALRKFEWSNDDRCPCCDSYRPADHEDVCALGDALALLDEDDALSILEEVRTACDADEGESALDAAKDLARSHYEAVRRYMQAERERDEAVGILRDWAHGVDKDDDDDLRTTYDVTDLFLARLDGAKEQSK